MALPAPSLLRCYPAVYRLGKSHNKLRAFLLTSHSKSSHLHQRLLSAAPGLMWGRVVLKLQADDFTFYFKCLLLCSLCLIKTRKTDGEDGEDERGSHVRLNTRTHTHLTI